MATLCLSPLLPAPNRCRRVRPIFVSSSKNPISLVNSLAQFPESALPLSCPQNPLKSSPFLHSLQRRRKNPKVHAIVEGEITLQTVVQDAQQIVSENGDSWSSIVALLLGVAFVGLTILTIGAIYLAVTDFLQKREMDKFEKEEVANKKKKSGKKRVVRAKTGPRGFGQKLEEEDEEIE